MTVPEYLKASIKDCKNHIKPLLLYSVLIRILLFSLTLFSDVMNERYLQFLMFYEIYENPDIIDILVVPLIYFIQMFATEVLVTLPIYLIFFKGNGKLSKPQVKSFIIFKAIIFIFYSVLILAFWHCFNYAVMVAIALAMLFSVFFKDMIKVKIVTENSSVFDAIKECFKIVEAQKFKRFLTFFTIELIYFALHLVVIVGIVIAEPIAYILYVPQWLFVVSPIIDIFAEPLRISFHLNFFYPKKEISL